LAGFILLVCFVVSTVTDGSLADDLLTDSLKITLAVVIAWLGSFLAVFVPWVCERWLPPPVRIEWFFD